MADNILNVPVVPVVDAPLDEIRALGIIVTWSAGRAEASQQGVEDTFASVGFGEFAPKARTLRDSLHSGLVAEYSQKNRPVRPTQRGYEVVEETATVDGTANNRTRVLGAWIDRDRNAGADVIRVDVPELYDTVKAAADAAQKRVDGTAIGKALTEVAGTVLKGVLIRDAGGAFWLPPESMATWLLLSEKLAATGAVKFRKFTVTGDAGTVDSLVDSATAKVEGILATLTADLDKGTLGHRALQSRAEEAQKLEEDIIAWETALGRALDTIREKAEETRTRAAQAALAAMTAQDANEAAA